MKCNKWHKNQVIYIQNIEIDQTPVKFMAKLIHLLNIMSL